MSIWTRVFGGWRTWGPNVPGVVIGGYDSPTDRSYDTVTPDAAMKLSAVWACIHHRAETIGALPCHLRDDKKNVIHDHPVYDLIHNKPNAMMTPPEFFSLAVANLDMHGNGVCIMPRRRDKSIISLDPIDPTSTLMKQRKSGAWYYEFDGEQYDADDVLHFRGFTTKGLWGLPRIDIGRQILSAQLSANESAQRAFRQSLKLGGFFKVEQNLNNDQLSDFNKRLDMYGRPENHGKFLTLLRGMTPVAGADFRIKPSDAELLQSRYFGIEEICRLFGVPPQLIFHTDKSSSWASSAEQINLQYLMYSLQSTLVRLEKRMERQLLTAEDRARGLQIKFSIQGLLRADLKTRQAFYASALQNGYYSRNEVRDLEDRGGIPGGDEYTIQTNLAPVDQQAADVSKMKDEIQ